MSSLRFASFPPPTSEGHIVDRICNAVGEKTACCVGIYAPEIFGDDMGSEHITVLPQKVLEQVSERLGTKVSVVTEKAKFNISAWGLCVNTGNAVPLPEKLHGSVKIKKNIFHFAVVGSVCKYQVHPEFWGFKTYECIVNDCEQESYIKFEKENFCIWDCPIPMLTLVIGEKPKKKRKRETPEERRNRQMKKMKTLFVDFETKVLNVINQINNVFNVYISHDGFSLDVDPGTVIEFNISKIKKAFTLFVPMSVSDSERQRLIDYKELFSEAVPEITVGETIVALGLMNIFPLQTQQPSLYRFIEWGKLN